MHATVRGLAISRYIERNVVTDQLVAVRLQWEFCWPRLVDVHTRSNGRSGFWQRSIAALQRELGFQMRQNRRFVFSA